MGLIKSIPIKTKGKNTPSNRRIGPQLIVIPMHSKAKGSTMFAKTPPIKEFCM